MEAWAGPPTMEASRFEGTILPPKFCWYSQEYPVKDWKHARYSLCRFSTRLNDLLRNTLLPSPTIQLSCSFVLNSHFPSRISFKALFRFCVGKSHLSIGADFPLIGFAMHQLMACRAPSCLEFVEQPGTVSAGPSPQRVLTAEPESNTPCKILHQCSS